MDSPKRGREGDATDTMIKQLLDEEQAVKKQKKGGPEAARPEGRAHAANKGKTFAEIEAEEGGPVKESLVGMAQTKRALDRKKRDVGDDTDVGGDTQRYEQEGLEVEEEDGIKFEPFNLKQEREEGFFDEEGNYVLRKGREGSEGPEEKDAWLDSEEAKVVSEEVKRKLEEQRAKAEAAAHRGPLTDRQIAQKKYDMAGVMLPGETVTRALKRLGTAAGRAGGGEQPRKAMGKREKARLLAQQQEQQAKAAAVAAAGAGGEGAAAAVADAGAGFEKLTELTDELLEEGEMDIYDVTKEELLRSARMWLPQLFAGSGGGSGGGSGAGGGGGAAAPGVGAAAGAGAAGAGRGAAAAGTGGGDDSDDDMFADDGDEGGGKKGPGAGGAGAAAAAAGSSAAVDEDEDIFGDGAGGGGEGKGGAGDGAKTSAPASNGAAGSGGGAAGHGGQPPPKAAAAPAAAKDEVDYSGWPVKELKRLLQERNVDPSGLVEKADLVAKVKEVLAAEGAGGGADGAAAAAGGEFVAPPGYAFDPSSGYFYSADTGMYYDTSSGGYCQASTGRWFWLDASTGSFVEWKQG